MQNTRSCPQNDVQEFDWSGSGWVLHASTGSYLIKIQKNQLNHQNVLRVLTFWMHFVHLDSSIGLTTKLYAIQKLVITARNNPTKQIKHFKNRKHK